MVALLVGLAIMSVALSVALPTWSTLAKREREEELIFRGQQYARAVTLFQRRYANAFPPSFDVLVEQKFLRKKYKDPMTEDGEFQPVLVGQTLPGQAPAGQQGNGAAQPGRAGAPGARAGQQGRGGLPGQTVSTPFQTGRVGGAVTGLLGVVSKSDAASLRLYNGRGKYNEWAFVAIQATTAAGGRGGGAPGQIDGRRGGGPPGGRVGPPGRGFPTPGGRRGP